jgi:nucleotide-binding universal stress UspA family protein
MIATILVYLDGSKLAEQILPQVTDIALSLKSKLILLRLNIDRPNTIYTDGYPEVRDAYKEIVTKEMKRGKNDAMSYLESIAGPLQKKGLDVNCIVLAGLSGNNLIKYAESNKVDLIAIATHRSSKLKRLISSSVADFLLMNSHLPILLINSNSNLNKT